jgi:hypothetical protein
MRQVAYKTRRTMSHGRADGPSQTGDVNNEAEHGVVADTETWSPSVLRGGPVLFHDLLLSGISTARSNPTAIPRQR